MLITAVRFSGTARDEFLSYASVVFDECFVVNNLKLVKSRSKPGEVMVCMPCKQKDNGDYCDIAHPITQEFRAYVQQYLVQAWNERPSPVQTSAR